MSSKILRRGVNLVAANLVTASLVTASLLVATAVSAHAAAADSAHRVRHAYPNRAYASRAYPNRVYATRPLAGHRYAARDYAGRRGSWVARGATLPYGPEYGFLRQVPANAIVGPSYTFVPGVGILGESCDLPSSACTNEYRDVH